eukprot:14079607-Ditylum_brightwellii.AAC.1
MLCDPAYHPQRLQRERSGAVVPNRHLDINDGVGISLPKVADQEVTIKAIILLLVVACDSGDLGFLWV